jgi:hypothetical protein
MTRSGANHIAPIRSILIDSGRRPSIFYARHEKIFRRADNHVTNIVGVEFSCSRALFAR